MSKLNSKLMKAEAIVASGKVVCPGVSEATLVYMLTCLRQDELKKVYAATVVEWFNVKESQS